MPSVSDHRSAARRRLPRFLFDYLEGGAGSERTLARNVRDLDRIEIRQRVLRDVSRIDLTTAWLGAPQAMPIGLGPVGLAGMYARRGEVQAARAAHAAGIPFCLSTVSVCGLKEVNASAGAAPWFQLYMVRDRGFMRDLIRSAQDLGCGALVFTVDMPAPGVRHRDGRSGLSGRFGPSRRLFQALGKPRWAADVGLLGKPHTLGNVAPVLKGGSGMEDFMGWLGANFDPSISWADLDWIRDNWSGPLIIKGILDVEDARRARELGSQGVVVSNHGGRQLDGAISTARRLPAIADAVRQDMLVLADSGVRSGADVFRMLALGADGVLLGRAWVYALAAAGGRGVSECLEMFERELRTTMALAGCTRLDAINPTSLENTYRTKDF